MLVGQVAALLRRQGWGVEIEVSDSEYGERGSYVAIAFRADSGTLLVVEVKTDVASVEATLRRLDEKARLGPMVAPDQYAASLRTASAMRSGLGMNQSSRTWL